MKRPALITVLSALSVVPACPTDCHVVEGDRILASDLARINPAFAALDPGMIVAYTPSPGLKRILTARQLKRLARRHGLSGDGIERMCFARATEPLGPERVVEALLKALGMPQAEIELIDFSRRDVPKGELQFRRTGLRRPLGDTPALWRGVVWYGSRRSLPIWARLKIRLGWRQVVALRDLTPAQPIAPGNLQVVAVEGFPPTEQPATSIEEVAGSRPRRRIAAGEPLLPSALTFPHDVERGSKVRVVISSGAARIQFEAEAEAAGSRGDRIPVRNPVSGKRFTATVRAKGEVVVRTGNREEGS